MESDWSEWSEEEMISLMREDYPTVNTQASETHAKFETCISILQPDSNNIDCNKSTSESSLGFGNRKAKCEEEYSIKETFYSENSNPAERTTYLQQNGINGNDTGECDLKSLSSNDQASLYLKTSKRKEKRRNKKRKETVLDEIKYDSSSDDDIPLSYYAKGSSVLPNSDNNGHQVSVEQTAEVIRNVVQESAQMAEIQEQIIQREAAKVDRILAEHNLIRENVAPYGNCFFESCAKQLNTDPTVLRSKICETLEENVEDYIAFAVSDQKQENNADPENEYLSEIQKLKKDGYWTSYVADLLPLALANAFQCNIVIYTNNDNQPIIKIFPVYTGRCELGSAEKPEIKLAYISIPGIIEHYDACWESLSEQDTYFATPLLEKIGDNADQTGESDIPDNPSSKNKTPRKKAVFVTPDKKIITRKRKAAPHNWKRNVRKQLRLSGEAYVSTCGKIVHAKSLQQVDCSTCRLKCHTNISQDQRLHLLNSFWALANYERQKDYVCARIEEKGTKTQVDETGKLMSKRKQVARKFYLEVDSERHQVCKSFFLKTLSVGKAYVDHAMTKKEKGHFSGKDLRGHNEPYNKIGQEDINHVKKHIESFPRIEGHYVRKETNRQYLGPELNLAKMYELYLEKCKLEKLNPVKSSKYRQIFNENYNLSFHIPKKDQCNTCSRYYNAVEKGMVTVEQKRDYEAHQKRKQRAREEKNNDKDKAKENSNVNVCCFDLQSVLYTPCSLVSLMYYMRKLCCYNLSFYSLGDAKGQCFVWTETYGKRGSSEVSTCLQLYLKSLPQNVNHVIFYSDACGGQNRNKIIASCLLHSVNTLDNINVIDHKFLESGHTHMEVDSMHAAVEFAKKKTQTFVPSQWDTVIQMARRRNPYTVIPLKHTDILDFKHYQATYMKPQKKTDTGSKVCWNKMKWLRYLKSEPDVCYFKYEIDSDFQKVKVVGPRKQQSSTDDSLPFKYQKKLPISSAKKKDLLHLCKSGVIPPEYHEFYKSLPSSNSSKDCLPEPDTLEDSGDESENE